MEDGDRIRRSGVGQDAFQNAERDEGGEALAIGRNLSEGVPAIGLREGLDPFAPVGTEVFEGESGSVGLGIADHGAGKVTLIESRSLRLCRSLRGVFAISADAKRAPGAGSNPGGKKEFLEGGKVGKVRPCTTPGRSGDRAEGKAFAGKGNSGREETGEGQTAESPVQLHPSVHRARYRDGLPAQGGHKRATGEAVRIPGARGAPGAV